jgi:pimeloyl-ACP methyl ester carboxylesterase
VIALDLSGHGDSGLRQVYDPHQWAEEVVAVAAADGMDRPVVVGHSMGGWVAVTTGVDHGDEVGAVAVIDSPLYDQPPEEDRLRRRRNPTRIYPTAESATARFTPLPQQDLVLPYIRDHVADQSLRRVEGGWTWKFDPHAFGRRPALRELLPRLTVPAALFRCEHGMVTEAMAKDMASLVGGRLPVVDVPDAGHHPMLDQPLALVTALRTLLALWPATTSST